MNASPDKPTLREQLDAVRPDSDDLRDVGLQEAARAVQTSDEWQQTLARQEAFDRQVATAMQGIEVPDGLQARLMAALADAGRQDSEPESVPTAAELQKPPTRRRTVLKLTAVAAGLLLMVATGWLLVPRDGEQMSLEQTRQQIPTLADGSIDTSKLPEFDGNFAIELPRPFQDKTRMVSELKGLDWTGDDRHDGAIYEFRAGGRIHGYLLILHSTRITDPPNLMRISGSADAYLPVPNTAWVDRDMKLAYICYVDQGDLQTLQRLLYPHAA